VAGNTTERGYGWSHQQERERWRPLVKAGKVDCSRCVARGEPDPRIHPWQDWDLGHDDTDPKKRTYSGPEHRHCNRAAGGQKGAARRGWAWKPRPRRVHQELSVDPADL
jgi:hypothetical protein